MSVTDLLLHGFAGTGRSWEPVIQAAGRPGWRPNAPDLPGHGQQSVDPGEDVPALAARLAATFAPVATLAGYSLGGRIALQMALDHPGCAERLVLISCSPGIEDSGERRARQEADGALAARIERADPAEVAELWLATPLFANDPPAVQELAAAQVVRSRPAGLAGALRSLGPGGMDPLWERLTELELPLTILVGGRDTRYCGLGERMAGLVAGARLVVVPGAGHALLREAPDAVAVELDRAGAG